MFLVKQKTFLFMLTLVVGVIISDFYVAPAQGLKCRSCADKDCNKKFDDWKEQNCPKELDICSYSVVSKSDGTDYAIGGCGTSEQLKLCPGVTCEDFKNVTCTVKDVKDPDATPTMQRVEAKFCHCKTDNCDPRGSKRGDSSRPHPGKLVILMSALLSSVPAISVGRGSS